MIRFSGEHGRTKAVDNDAAQASGCLGQDVELLISPQPVKGEEERHTDEQQSENDARRQPNREPITKRDWSV